MEKTCYIFDVDGTLYSQKKMHILMAVKLLGYYGTHWSKWKELYSLYLFRKFRERESYRKLSVEELAQRVGKEIKTDPNIVEKVIENWMFQIPIELLSKCAYQDVLEEIALLHSHGCKIYIYSDYPAKKKIEKLNVPAEYIFTAEDEDIHELKPSEKAINVILNKIGVDSSKIMYIGDRDEKDGVSAKLASIDYCNVKEWKKSIKGKADYE